MKTIETKNHKLGRTIGICLRAFNMGSIVLTVYQGKRKNHDYECRLICDYDTLIYV